VVGEEIDGKQAVGKVFKELGSRDDTRLLGPHYNYLK
jgi:hypothetical protein